MIKKHLAAHRIAARKSIASMEMRLKGLKGCERSDILQRISGEQKFLEQDLSKINTFEELNNILLKTRFKYAEMMPGLPGAPNQYVYPDSMPTFSRLMSVLEEMEREERESLEYDKNPSDNDIKRWALRAALLEYYKGIYSNPDAVVADYYEGLQIKRDFAPKQEDVFKIWIRRLEEQSRAKDKHKLSMDEYMEAVNRGYGRGTAFEKQLERYREDFMEELWKKHYEEVNNARQNNSQ